MTALGKGREAGGTRGQLGVRSEGLGGPRTAWGEGLEVPVTVRGERRGVGGAWPGGTRGGTCWLETAHSSEDGRGGRPSWSQGASPGCWAQEEGTGVLVLLSFP